MLRTWISSIVAHANILPLVAAPVTATHGTAAILAVAAAACLVSPRDVVQLPALRFKSFALFDCPVVHQAESAGTTSGGAVAVARETGCKCKQVNTPLVLGGCSLALNLNLILHSVYKDM